MTSLITLKQTDDFAGLLEGTFHSTLFDTEVTAWIEPEVSMDYAEACVAHFNGLPAAQVDGFCDMAIRYCEFMRAEWGYFEDVCEGISAAIAGMFPLPPERREVMRGIAINSLFIGVPQSEEPAYSVEFNCVWEPEHGMDWIIRGDKNLYAGPCEGLGPWCEPSEYDWFF